MGTFGDQAFSSQNSNPVNQLLLSLNSYYLSNVRKLLQGPGAVRALDFRRFQLSLDTTSIRKLTIRELSDRHDVCHKLVYEKLIFIQNSNPTEEVYK